MHQVRIPPHRYTLGSIDKPITVAITNHLALHLGMTFSRKFDEYESAMGMRLLDDDGKYRPVLLRAVHYPNRIEPGLELEIAWAKTSEPSAAVIEAWRTKVLAALETLP